MGRTKKAGVLVALLLTLALAAALSASPVLGGGGQGIERSEVISVLGVAQVGGNQVYVDVMVEVQAGANANEAAQAALASQGARPLASAGLGSGGDSSLPVWSGQAIR